MGSNDTVQDYLKIFLISLVTSVAVLFALGPFMLKLQGTQEPAAPQAQQPGATTTAPAEVAQPGAKMTAPNLLGLDLREARTMWRAQGIVIIEDSQRVDNAVEAGTILSQSPDGGAPLQTKEIRVVVAAAPEMVTVPSVIGKSSTEATEALVEAGFEVPAPEREPSTEPPGQVLRQEPNAGSKSEKGSLVRLVVSGEPEAETEGAPEEPAEVEVPRVKRMRIGSARKKIEKAGLVVGSVRMGDDPELTAYRVLSQDPRAGTKVPEGSEVDLVIIRPE